MDEQLKLLELAIKEYSEQDHASGVCCCGDCMEDHPNPIICGHSPVDQGEWCAAGLVADSKEALNQIRRELKNRQGAARYARRLLEQTLKYVGMSSGQEARALAFKIQAFLKREEGK